MAWVTGIREVRMIQPETEREGDGRQSMGRQSIPKPQRLVVTLPVGCVVGTIRQGPTVVLPVHTGAGPCGTHARRERALGVIAWSIVHLIEPLQAWYAEQNRPRDPLSRAGCLIGAKSGGGNGRANLW